MNNHSAKNPGGRPPKFQEERRPVTMTLPLRVLDQLAEIDGDRARAVVKVTEAAVGASGSGGKSVELVEMAPSKSLIVIGPCAALKHIPFLKTIEIAPARYLLTLPSGTPVEALEVSLRDLYQRPELKDQARDIAILEELISLLGQQRRNRRLSKAEVLIINTG